MCLATHISVSLDQPGGHIGAASACHPKMPKGGFVNGLTKCCGDPHPSQNIRQRRNASATGQKLTVFSPSKW